MASIGARTAVLLTVSQTVSQNRAFDLFADSAKILIRLKVRTGMVPEQGIEPLSSAPFPKFQGPRTAYQAPDFQASPIIVKQEYRPPNRCDAVFDPHWGHNQCEQHAVWPCCPK